MREAEARLQAMGCIKVNLQVRSSNAAVVEFYRRLGYSIEGRVLIDDVASLLCAATDG